MAIAFKIWTTPTKIDLLNLWESNSAHNIPEIIKSRQYLLLQIMTAADTEVAWAANVCYLQANTEAK